MTTANSPNKELQAENESLRIRLEEAEETLRAIGSGEVDAFVVSGPEGDQVFTLKGAELPYRVLVETMNEGAATLDADGTILYCNNRLAAMLQVSLEKIIGMQLGSYVDPADRPLFMARLGKCTIECDKDEIAMITGTGASVPVLISCCAADISSNRNISLVVTDLTKQKRNEEIRAAEMLARSIIEQAGEAIIVCDEEGMIIRASRLAHNLCGENLLLKSFNELFNLRIPETGSLFSVVAPLNDAHIENLEVEFNRSNDQIYHLILNATPLKFVQDRVNGCVVTLTDISERKKAEEALRHSESRLQTAYNQLQIANEQTQSQSEELQAQSEELQAQSEELQAQSEELQEQNRELARLWEESKQAKETLKELNDELENRVAERTAELRDKDQMLLLQSRQAAMGEMIGNIAHQWRQPLNTLGLHIQSLQLFFDSGLITKELVDSTTSESMRLINHMSLTIDDFRNYFAPNKEKVEFSAGKALANTLSLLEGSFQSPKIDIEIIEKDDLVIYGYQNEFAQVLLNIIINARDALIEKEIDDPRVTITLCREGGCAVVTIADNAGGVPEEILDKIFDPYFTTKGPQKGTGVGLFMSKAIIEKNMVGRLAVRNAADGAEFRIEVCNETKN